MGFRKELPVAISVLLALVPLLLFAYLGQFSRLIADDYGHLGKAHRIRGPGKQYYFGARIGTVIIQTFCFMVS